MSKPIPIPCPLALNAAEVQKLCAAGLMRPPGIVYVLPQGGQPSDGKLRAAAEHYLSLPATPAGTAKALATERGLNFHSLLQTISTVRQERAAAERGTAA